MKKDCFSIKFLVVLTALATAGAYNLPAAIAQEATGVENAKSLSQAFRTVAKKTVPTVVKIHALTKAKTINAAQGGEGEEINPFKGSPFEEFFKDQPGRPGFRFQVPNGRIPPRQGVGSGVIIDPKGVILTNNHVVDGADTVEVELSDGRTFKATDIKTDPDSDLAVIRIDAKDTLPAAKLGDSDAMDIGDWVVAVGCPFELDSTVSAGIISAKGRAISSEKRAKNYLQTDAAINPGNSGGPLVNLEGEVIGINTAIATNNGAYQGVGFAIPSNLAKWVMTQLVEHGSVQRSYLGVQIRVIDAELAAQLNVAPNSGVIVTEVKPDSPAADAGVQLGDIILTFAGKKVGSPSELQQVVEKAPVGSKQKISLVRVGKPETLAVEMKALPEEYSVAGGKPSNGKATRSSKGFSSKEFGFEVTDLTPDVAKKLDIDSKTGVIITSVDPDGIAATKGLQEGMVILKVGQVNVKSLPEFKAAMAKESPEKGVLLLVHTRAGNNYVVLKQD